jgi:hypothetical protein
MADWHPAAGEDEVLARLGLILSERVAGLDPAERERIEAAPDAVTRVEPLDGGQWLRIYVELDPVLGERVDLGELSQRVFDQEPPVPN